MGKIIKWILVLAILCVAIYFVYQWTGRNSDTSTITDGTLIQRGWQWIERKM